MRRNVRKHRGEERKDMKSRVEGEKRERRCNVTLL